ncbi:class II fructose-bisphosphate aldolase [Nocardioides rotundus]|uniref:class II fructose-bisphosphate aldolase n=1 Tax=Nocardioides rotundus TaxID=1774216 RepID=UPI001CBBD8A5|nr:class II fructose-bisphosphate aldolase [Nocardioides rotundus]UAL28514.1 class II fructose-bisphosphate aldolase [Nocardioides rotundus]
MPLTPTGDVVSAAQRARCAVGAFNVIQLESAEAIVRGAESADLPVIMQISENCVRYHGALAPIARATLAMAEAAKVPVSVHLDHAECPELVHEAVELGFTSVMYDGARLDYDANVSATRELVQACHAAGVWVEAELGEIGGKEGAHAPGVRTDPGEAAEFVVATGVDALAVAVGSEHAMLTRDAALDHRLIARLASATPVPLVLHGSSGVSDRELVRAADGGMAKINVSTHLNKVFTGAVREHLRAHPRVVDTRKYLAPGRAAMADEVGRLLRLLAGRGPSSAQR